MISVYKDFLWECSFGGVFDGFIFGNGKDADNVFTEKQRLKDFFPYILCGFIFADRYVMFSETFS